MRILIVEDDPVLADGLNRSLRATDYAVDCAAEVEKIVVGLNERRISKKGRQPPPKPTQQAKPAQPSAPSEGSQDGDA